MDKYLDEVNTIIKNNDADTIIKYWQAFLNTFSCKPDEEKFPKCKVGDVINEDMSVKWNREEVNIRIMARNEEVKRLNRLKVFVNEKYKEGIIKVLAKENKIKIDESKIIWNKAYEMEHSNGLYAVKNEYEELVDMYKDLLEIKKKA